MDSPPQCLEAVSKPRPRCSHILASRCFEAKILEELWSEQHGESVTSNPPQVIHGVKYGPSESVLGLSGSLRKSFNECYVKTTYCASCGHSSTLTCSHAFQTGAGERKEASCSEATSFRSPICGHEIVGPCHLKVACLKVAASILFERTCPESGAIDRIADENTIVSALPLPRFIKDLKSSCSKTVTVARKCGHNTSGIPCAQLPSILETKILPLRSSSIAQAGLRTYI